MLAVLPSNRPETGMYDGLVHIASDDGLVHTPDAIFAQPPGHFEANRAAGYFVPGPAGHTVPGPAGHTVPGPAGHTVPGSVGRSFLVPSGHAAVGAGGRFNPGPTGHTVPGPTGHTVPGPAGHMTAVFAISPGQLTTVIEAGDAGRMINVRT